MITDNFKNSRMVNMRFLEISISNRYGKYWNFIRDHIYGIDDLRARSGSFTTPWAAHIDTLFTPPPLVYIPDRLSDLLDNRAIELNNIAKESNKKLILMWSGGIDSTSVVSAFIKNLSKQDLKNILICLSSDSILENTNFYLSHISPNFEYISYYDIEVSDAFLADNILVHGDPGDCIYGPSLAMYKNLISDGRHLQPWRNNLPNIINEINAVNLNTNIPDGFANWYVDKITTNLLEVGPEGVDSVSDWWWWHYFNFKWEFSVSRPFFNMRSNLKSSINHDNFLFYVGNTFFNTPKFQQWSYSNLKTHVGNTMQDHKIQAKKYIFELDNNEEYFCTKTKTASKPAKRSSRIKPVFYDNNWVAHDMDEPGVWDTMIELLENYQG